MDTIKSFVWISDRFGLVNAYPGNKVEVNELPGGTYVSIYEPGKKSPTKVVEGVVVYVGPERRRKERGAENHVEYNLVGGKIQK